MFFVPKGKVDHDVAVATAKLKLTYKENIIKAIRDVEEKADIELTYQKYLELKSKADNNDLDAVFVNACVSMLSTLITKYQESNPEIVTEDFLKVCFDSRGQEK